MVYLVIHGVLWAWSWTWTEYKYAIAIESFNGGMAVGLISVKVGSGGTTTNTTSTFIEDVPVQQHGPHHPGITIRNDTFSTVSASNRNVINAPTTIANAAWMNSGQNENYTEADEVILEQFTTVNNDNSNSLLGHTIDVNIHMDDHDMEQTAVINSAFSGAIDIMEDDHDAECNPDDNANANAESMEPTHVEKGDDNDIDMDKSNEIVDNAVNLKDNDVDNPVANQCTVDIDNQNEPALECVVADEPEIDINNIVANDNESDVASTVIMSDHSNDNLPV